MLLGLKLPHPVLAQVTDHVTPAPVLSPVTVAVSMVLLPTPTDEGAFVMATEIELCVFPLFPAHAVSQTPRATRPTTLTDVEAIDFLPF